LKKEFALLKTLHHPGIVEAFELHESLKDAGFTMRYCPGAKLSEFLPGVRGRMTPLSMHGIAQQLLHAAAYMHSLGIAHRDLHAGNVMMDSELHGSVVEIRSVVIIDFGSATADLDKDFEPCCHHMDKSEASVSRSSVFAEENTLASILPPSTSYGMGSAAKRDAFALGLLVVSLVRCKVTDAQDLFDEGESPKLQGDWSSQAPLSKSLAKLVQQLLELDPILRITATLALQELPAVHDWSSVSPVSVSDLGPWKMSL